MIKTLKTIFKSRFVWFSLSLSSSSLRLEQTSTYASNVSHPQEKESSSCCVLCVHDCPRLNSLFSFSFRLCRDLIDELCGRDENDAEREMDWS